MELDLVVEILLRTRTAPEEGIQELRDSLNHAAHTLLVARRLVKVEDNLPPW
jgi:hypothetical protein